MTRRFRYVLEPLRLQRDWSLMQLRLQLAECNEALAGQERKVEALQRQAETVRQQWRDAAGPDRALRLETLTAYSGYLAQLERGIEDAAASLESLRREREQAAFRVAQATRELDAVERHKVDQRAAFSAGQGKAQMRDADDHWSILRTRSANARQA
jgi:flagellar biosynthesis chaperone FliJ